MLVLRFVFQGTYVPVLSSASKHPSKGYLEDFCCLRVIHYGLTKNIALVAHNILFFGPRLHMHQATRRTFESRIKYLPTLMPTWKHCQAPEQRNCLPATQRKTHSMRNTSNLHGQHNPDRQIT